MDSGELYWTDADPVEEGWYWVDRFDSAEPIVVYVGAVVHGSPMLCVHQHYLGDDGDYYGALAGFARGWAGPIASPTIMPLPRVAQKGPL